MFLFQSFRILKSASKDAVERRISHEEGLETSGSGRSDCFNVDYNSKRCGTIWSGGIPMIRMRRRSAACSMNKKINADGLVGQYSVYIPENFEPCTDGVMILTPDGMTAKSFVESEKGQAWKALSDELGIATVYVEPQDGQTWNIDLSDDDRDDQAFLKKSLRYYPQ